MARFVHPLKREALCFASAVKNSKLLSYSVRCKNRGTLKVRSEGNNSQAINFVPRAASAQGAREENFGVSELREM